mmetsp:Transcript_5279/g.12684  ORF Transcript_5279/g.12684 Transcript_5279/m.12684 type:complete len:253 (-) Transcript_5279:85-843(-)
MTLHGALSSCPHTLLPDPHLTLADLTSLSSAFPLPPLPLPRLLLLLLEQGLPGFALLLCLLFPLCLDVLEDHVCASDLLLLAVVEHLVAAVPAVRGELDERRVEVRCREVGASLHGTHVAVLLAHIQLCLDEPHPRQAHLPPRGPVRIEAVHRTPELRELTREVLAMVELSPAVFDNRLALASVYWVRHAHGVVKVQRGIFLAAVPKEARLRRQHTQQQRDQRHSLHSFSLSRFLFASQLAAPSCGNAQMPV